MPKSAKGVFDLAPIEPEPEPEESTPSILDGVSEPLVRVIKMLTEIVYRYAQTQGIPDWDLAHIVGAYTSAVDEDSFLLHQLEDELYHTKADNHA